MFSLYFGGQCGGKKILGSNLWIFMVLRQKCHFIFSSLKSVWQELHLQMTILAQGGFFSYRAQTEARLIEIALCRNHDISASLFYLFYSVGLNEDSFHTDQKTTGKDNWMYICIFHYLSLPPQPSSSWAISLSFTLLLLRKGGFCGFCFYFETATVLTSSLELWRLLISLTAGSRVIDSNQA